MRIYTEVNFQWDDKKGKLVEVSSDSFDYSGEMALCATTVAIEWYDEAGNKFRHTYEMKKNPRRADEGKFYKSENGAWVLKAEKKKQHLGNSEHVEWGKAQFRSLGVGDQFFDTDQASKDYWNREYHMERPDGSDAQIQESIDRYTSEEWTYAGLAGWQKITDIEGEEGWTETDGEWTFAPPEEDVQAITDLLGATEGDENYDETYDINDDGVIDQADLDALGAPEAAVTLSTDKAKRGAQIAIKEYIDNWKDIVDPGIEDAAQLLIEGYGRDLKEKEEDVRTAYEDIFGEEGTIFDIEETYETAEERGREKFTTDIGLAETAKEEGLEETVVGREGELEALRGEAAVEIRAAEAKIGAAGFASTGVGQTARDVLAEEIGGAARGIDEGFTEERSDVKRSYLEKVDPLEKEYGEEGTAYDDYIRDRDQAAKGALSAWETASTAYGRAKTTYEAEQQPTAGFVYKEKLEETGGLISSAILDITQGIGTEAALDEAWDPFGTDFLSGYTAEQFGIDPTTMEFMGIPTEGELDVFAEPFYEPYEVDPGLELYDPEKKLPWYEPTKEDMLKDLAPKTYKPPFTISDINVKKDITRISKLKNGIPVYLFRYKWSNKMNVGVMAQDVEKIIPDAVVEIDGIKAVNYSMLNKEE